jgi:hypothetical protein
MIAALSPRPRTTLRPAFSLLELEVALVLLGIALVGLFPLVVVQSRVVENLEWPLDGRQERYLVASTDAWARKLGAAAALVNNDPGPPPAEPVLNVDNGDQAYTDTGSWTKAKGKVGYQGDSERHEPIPSGVPATSEPDRAVWTFADIPAGWYFVEATWIEAADQADNARYRFYDGDTLVGDATANQRVVPAGPTYEGRPWQVLATAHFKEGNIRVELESQASGYVVADGVRLAPAGNVVRVLACQRSLNTDEVTVQASVEPAGP